MIPLKKRGEAASHPLIVAEMIRNPPSPRLSGPRAGIQVRRGRAKTGSTSLYTQPRGSNDHRPVTPHCHYEPHPCHFEPLFVISSEAEKSKPAVGLSPSFRTQSGIQRGGGPFENQGHIEHWRARTTRTDEWSLYRVNAATANHRFRSLGCARDDIEAFAMAQ